MHSLPLKLRTFTDKTAVLTITTAPSSLFLQLIQYSNATIYFNATSKENKKAKRVCQKVTHPLFRAKNLAVS